MASKLEIAVGTGGWLCTGYKCKYCSVRQLLLQNSQTQGVLILSGTT